MIEVHCNHCPSKGSCLKKGELSERLWNDKRYEGAAVIETHIHYHCEESFCLALQHQQNSEGLSSNYSSSVIGISLEILRNMRSLTSTPCIFNAIYTYANEIQTIQLEEDRQGKLMTNYTFGNQRVRFQLNSQPHLPSLSQTFTRQRGNKSSRK